MTTPNPSNVAPWYLRNINQALALDETTGNVYIRTDAQIGDVTIEGNVNIPGNVAATQSGNWNVHQRAFLRNEKNQHLRPQTAPCRPTGWPTFAGQSQTLRPRRHDRAAHQNPRLL